MGAPIERANLDPESHKGADVRAQAGDGHLESKERGLRANPACLYQDLRMLGTKRCVELLWLLEIAGLVCGVATVAQEGQDGALES